MRARLPTFALLTALLYIATVLVLLVAMSSGVSSPYSVGALGAALAALTALAGLAVGFRIGRGESRFGAPHPAAETPVSIAAGPPAHADLGAARSSVPGFLIDEPLRSMPIGFAAIDGDLVIRLVNPALESILRTRGETLLGQNLRETRLGCAIDDGPRPTIAGRRLFEVAEQALHSGGTIDLERLLVPSDGEGWKARLTARIHGWPSFPGNPECLFVWVQEEPGALRGRASGAAAESEPPRLAPSRVAPAAAAPPTAPLPPPAPPPTRGDHAFETRSRLGLIASIAERLSEATIPEDEWARAELQMIRIQADRIATALSGRANEPGDPALASDDPLPRASLHIPTARRIRHPGENPLDSRSGGAV